MEISDLGFGVVFGVVRILAGLGGDEVVVGFFGDVVVSLGFSGPWVAFLIGMIFLLEGVTFKIKN